MGWNIFIYGTLKRGEPNHWLIKKLRRHARFLSVGITKGRIPLVIDSENSNVPILLDVPGEGKVVQGQVYAIDEKGIEILDLFEENHEIGAYRRVKVDIVLNNKFLRSHEDQDKIDCQCYVYNGTEAEIERLKKLPFRDIYQSNGDHGLAYRASSVDLEFGSTIIQNVIGEEFFHERRDFTDDTSDKQELGHIFFEVKRVPELSKNF